MGLVEYNENSNKGLCTIKIPLKLQDASNYDAGKT